jgi:hypothetical protein
MLLSPSYLIIHMLHMYCAMLIGFRPSAAIRTNQISLSKRQHQTPPPEYISLLAACVPKPFVFSPVYKGLTDTRSPRQRLLPCEGFSSPLSPPTRRILLGSAATGWR